MVRETVDRLRESQEENEMITPWRDELETQHISKVADLRQQLEKGTTNCAVKRVRGEPQDCEERKVGLVGWPSSREVEMSCPLLLSRSCHTSAGIEGGKNHAESVQDHERT
ncbi:hypothetical protein C8J57DRAFT_1085623 [Mycena rebaudengoi]|nr:hypothetical protein C8J57DRAFT_1101533 [Mycena rebaudengoi]KAJ7240753.1 hypothetical protein C8J57DRAFT_1085623 [Mycena rebaudengoi]